jgi:hypothetical protein
MAKRLSFRSLAFGLHGFYKCGISGHRSGIVGVHIVVGLDARESSGASRRYLS